MSPSFLYPTKTDVLDSNFDLARLFLSAPRGLFLSKLGIALDDRLRRMSPLPLSEDSGKLYMSSN
jgi:hypothetical protein